MAQGGLKRLQGSKDLRQMCIHPSWTLTPTTTGNTDSPAVRETFQLSPFRYIQKEDRFQTVGSEDFHDVGRTAEIIAIEGNHTA